MGTGPGAAGPGLGCCCCCSGGPGGSTALAGCGVLGGGGAAFAALRKGGGAFALGPRHPFMNAHSFLSLGSIMQLYTLYDTCDKLHSQIWAQSLMVS